jgi:hypothetical protein
VECSLVKVAQDPVRKASEGRGRHGRPSRPKQACWRVSGSVQEEEGTLGAVDSVGFRETTGPAALQGEQRFGAVSPAS